MSTLVKRQCGFVAMNACKMGEPDLISNTIQQSVDDDFGPNLIRLRVTDQVKELQTVLRDR